MTHMADYKRHNIANILKCYCSKLRPNKNKQLVCHLTLATI